MAVVQRAHGRDEADDALGAARRAQRRAHLGDGAHRPHAATARVAAGEDVVELEQVGRALGDRLAVAGHGGLVAAGDRPGQRGVALDRPALDRRAHERDEQLALDARRGRHAAPPRTRASPGSSRPSTRRRGRRCGPRRRSRRRACPARRPAGGRGPGRAASSRRSRIRRPRSRRPRGVTVMSGCSAKASCGASTSSPVAPEQCPTSGPGAMAAAAAAISASGTQSRTTSAPAPAYPRPCGSRRPQGGGQGAAEAACAHDGDRVLHLMSDPAPDSGCRSPAVPQDYPLAGTEPRRLRLWSRTDSRASVYALDRAAFEAGAPGRAQGRLPPGTGLPPLPAARRHPQHRGLRLGQRRRRPDVRRRGPGQERGRAGPAVRRAGRASCSTGCWGRSG